MDLSTYLEGLLQKPFIPTSELALFLTEMKKTASGPLLTSKLVAAKIQSGSETQAMRAFDFLENALSTDTDGSKEFRTEIGRYRFLNELIRILSPKFYGSQTLPSVKERAIRFLTDAARSKRRQWFPSENCKVEAVYNSLVEGGVIGSTTDDADAEFQKSIFDRGENSILLKKLLQSKNPADLQAANRLIRNLVDEEAKRNERRSEMNSLIDRIETSRQLLIEMCSQPEIDEEIVEELISTCRTLRNKLGTIGTETGEEIASLLQASENIEKALNFSEDRKSQILKCTNDGTSKALIEHPTLLDSSPPIQGNVGMSLADELLIGLDLGGDTPQLLKQASESSNVHQNIPNLLNFDMPEISSNQVKDLKTIGRKVSSGDGLDDLRLLSRQLMEESLSGKGTLPFVSTLEAKSNKVPTLNELRQHTAPPTSLALLGHSAPLGIVTTAEVHSPPASLISSLDLDFLEKSNSTIPEQIDRNIILLEDEKPLDVINNQGKLNGILGTEIKADSQLSLEAITDIDLENIELLEDQPSITIALDSLRNDKNDKKEMLELMFTFGKLPGLSQDLTRVAIMTLTNRNPNLSLTEYSFQFLAPKGLQVKLFPPSSRELSPWKKRFLSPSLLSQVCVILVPKGKLGTTRGIKLKFILSFYLGDDASLYHSELELPF